MKEIRLARKIIRTLVKDRMHYPGRLVVDTFGGIARCGVTLALYGYVMQHLRGGTVNGTTFPVAAWSMFFYFALSTLRLRDISRLIMTDIRSGNVEVLFGKPISYLSYRWWWQIGMGIYSFVVIALLGGAALWLAVGIPEAMKAAIFLPTLLLAAVLCMVLSLVIYSIIGLLAFWIEDINPVFWMVDKAVLILGGSYLPVAFFPPFMYKLALYSPFGASQFVTHTVYDGWRESWMLHLGIQVFWVALLGLGMCAVYARARRRVSVNGG